MSYTAPLAEMRFALEQSAGGAELAALPGFEAAAPDLVETILGEAARLAETVLAPLNQPADPIDDYQLVDVRSDSPADRILKQERDARVRAAIAQLPEKQRAALILRTYHEMSHQEIADVLGSSVGAVKANFFHALGHLKKLLGDEI